MLVETESLTKQYGSIKALDGCTLAVNRGEVFGLLGPNGAGKTTLLRLLLGYLRPSSGRAMIDNLDCYHDSVQVHRQVSYLPGEPRLFPRMRGRGILQFFAEVRPGGDLPRSLALAERLELDLSRSVAFMSTGMRQKLALAATLATDSPLIILDEPTANLDPTVRATVMDMVAEAQQAGRTVIFSSHVLSEVEQVCDRVVILRGGQLVHTQAMAELRRRHRIQAHLAGSLPALPEHLTNQADIRTNGNGQVTIDTDGDLSPLLGWLATLSLREVTVEPVGLRAVYELYHSNSLPTNSSPTNSSSPHPESTRSP